jgi:hypothetical protein
MAGWRHFPMIALRTLLLTLLACPVAFAASFRYEFSGKVSTLFYDGGGVIAATGVKVGDPVTVTFDVNFDTKGYIRLNNGKLDAFELPEGWMTNAPSWYFYANLVGGTRLPAINGGFNNSPSDWAEYHFGVCTSYPNSPSDGRLEGGTGNSYVTVSKSSYLDPRVQTWTVGDKVKGVFVGYSDTDWSIYWADLTVDSITAIPEIPGVVETWESEQSAAAAAEAAAVQAREVRISQLERRVKKVKAIGNDKKRKRLLKHLRRELKELRSAVA